MESLYQYAWLIPVLPLIGATLVGIGLISVNQTTNKLRQLNAVFIISLLGVSTVLSFAILWSQIQGHPAYTMMFEWASAGRFSSQYGLYH
jgi:NAD(P)H-quinone oxidoreductase subunit 5